MFTNTHSVAGSGPLFLFFHRRENVRVQDLEIYIRDLEAGAVSRWLTNHLDRVALDDGVITAAVKGHASYDGSPLSLSLYPGAFGKRFTCLVIEGPKVPWACDLDCARSAWRTIGGELRCSPGSWVEGDAAAEEKWWRVDERGEQRAVWN